MSNFIFCLLKFLAILRDYYSSVIKLSVAIFGQTARYRIYTVSREPIKIPEIQYPVLRIYSSETSSFVVHVKILFP